MNDNGFHPEITRLGMPDEFVEHGTVEQLKQLCGLDRGSIKRAILKAIH